MFFIILCCVFVIVKFTLIILIMFCFLLLLSSFSFYITIYKKVHMCVYYFFTFVSRNLLFYNMRKATCCSFTAMLSKSILISLFSFSCVNDVAFQSEEEVSLTSHVCGRLGFSLKIFINDYNSHDVTKINIYMRASRHKDTSVAMK